MMKTIKLFDAAGNLAQSIKDREFKGIMHITMATFGGDDSNVMAITDRVADCVFLYDLRADKVVRKIGDNSGDDKWGPTEITCGADSIHIRDNTNMCVKS